MFAFCSTEMVHIFKWYHRRNIIARKQPAKHIVQYLELQKMYFGQCPWYKMTTVIYTWEELFGLKMVTVFITGNKIIKTFYTLIFLKKINWNTYKKENVYTAVYINNGQ